MLKFIITAISGISMVATAHAACIGATCEGKEASAEGCGSDAITVATKSINDPVTGVANSATLELRYSSKCQANWGLLSTRDLVGAQGSVTLGSISVVNTTLGKTQTYAPPYQLYQISSPMTYGKGKCTYAKGTIRKNGVAGSWSYVTMTMC